ncbi:MAG: hypothetical protein Q8O56_16585 [Solirubrobacteraceae bacterium]|nr:hypothetical protein [Solirubrobacteraceae bacterium]
MHRRRFAGRSAQRRSRALAVGGLGVAICVVVVSAAFAAPSATVVITDRSGDVSGPLDLTRASLQRASDGRLRAAVSFAASVTPRTLLASSGPPGSVCLRIWTRASADPKAMPPDRLVCVTARSAGEFRGGVYEVAGAQPPKRLSGASVSRTASGRSVIVRFTQSSLARPQRIRFSVESTRPGCERTSCIDTLPDAGATRVFRLR